jgi:hypothetical protein
VVVVSVELAIVDVSTSGCAKDGCVIGEEPPRIAGIVDNISSPNAKVIR